MRAFPSETHFGVLGGVGLAPCFAFGVMPRACAAQTTCTSTQIRQFKGHVAQTQLDYRTEMRERERAGEREGERGREREREREARKPRKRMKARSEKLTFGGARGT